jgi:acylphosphatase
MKKHFNIRVSGRVQGVYFRASTKRKADDLDIKGFVRNEPDGSVYIEAEGNEIQMTQFIEWCNKGPESARVSACTVAEGAGRNFDAFQILH